MQKTTILLLQWTQRLTNTSKTISRRFYRRILLTSWKRKIIGLCKYVRESKMRNITRAKMPNLGATIWRTVLNIKLLCFPRCVPKLLLSHLPKFIAFYLCIQMLPSKMQVGLTLAGPPCIYQLGTIQQCFASQLINMLKMLQQWLSWYDLIKSCPFICSNTESISILLINLTNKIFKK